MGVNVPIKTGSSWWPGPFLVLLACLLPVFGLLSFFRGQTADWDLLNYHLYNPHAWLTGRWLIDVAPAQAQSFHNPLLHLPYYLGFRYLPHSLLAVGVGALQALLIVPLYYLGRKLLAPLNVRPGLIAGLAAIGLMGPVFLSELGTDFGDNWLAIPILTALAIIVAEEPADIQGPSGLWALVAAGLISGAAVGLKLSFAFYLPALAASLLVTRRATGVLLPSLVFGIAAIAGLAGSAGWWMYHLWVEFGNPLFPYFNHWFQSPWAPLAANRDLRFVSGPLPGQLLKPLIGMFDYQQVLELKFRDFRPALVFLTVMVLPWIRLGNAQPVQFTRPLAATLVFLLTAWLGWSVLFAYYRYTVAIEALLPITLLALWMTLFRPGKAGVRALLTLLFVSQLLVKVPDWGRVDYGQLKLDLRMIHDSDLVLGAGSAPAGWLALELPDEVPFVRIAGNLYQPQDGTGLSAAALNAINDHPGRLLVVTARMETAQVSAELRRLGLYMDVYNCATIIEQSLPSLADRFWLCSVSRFNPGRAETLPM